MPTANAALLCLRASVATLRWERKSALGSEPPGPTVQMSLPELPPEWFKRKAQEGCPGAEEPEGSTAVGNPGHEVAGQHLQSS